MFVTLENKPRAELRPEWSSISASDWDILADFWYPVALARDVGADAMQATLLDVDLALFRGADGAVAAVLDMCPHRHVRLSPGRVIDGEIQCPFHGLRFDGSGRCTRVPALGPRGGRLPASYRVRAFAVRERYGLIWVCIGDPERNDIPEFPDLANIDPDALGYNEPVVWPVSAPRQVENFFDLAHLPIAHAATLGGDPDATVPPGRIEHTNDAVVLHARTSGIAKDGDVMHEDLTYRVVLPFAVDFHARSADVMRDMTSCDIASPISAYETRVFQVFRMTGDAAAHAELGAALVSVNNEDIALLSTQQMADLPLDQHHELHLPVDNMAYAYRSRLRDLGLGRA